MKKIIFFFFLVCFSVCVAQQKTITFVQKENTNKKFTNVLPAEADIFYKDKRRDYLLVIGSTDSTLICKLNIYATNPDTIIPVNEKIIPYAQRNIDNMITCGQQTLEQIRKEYFETNFKDTVRIKINEIDKIKIRNDVSDKMHKIAVALSAVSFVAALIGTAYATDSLTENKTMPTLLILSGTVGMITAGALVIGDKTIRTRKWKIEG